MNGNVTENIMIINDKHDKPYERLVAIRKKTGMSKKEFADYIGIPESTYRTYEAVNPKYRTHMKEYVIDLLEYKLTMEGALPGRNGNNVLDWMERIYNMLKESYEYRPVRRISFLSDTDRNESGNMLQEGAKSSKGK